MIVNKKEDKADMGGWVTIDNKSGKKYEKAKIKLIAGDVNTARPPSPIVANSFVRKAKLGGYTVS